MADAPELDVLWEKLDAAIKKEQHKKALKAVDEILAIEPKDEDALRVKASALLNLSEWDTALKLIESTAVLASSMQFEKAYCLYRLGKIPEGLACLKPLLPASAGGAGAGGPREGAALELAAQLHYRLGQAKECIQLYDTLFQQHKAGDSLELRTNVLAAYVAAGLARELPALMSAMKLSAKDSFEVGFNKACGLVEAGEWGAAEQELRHAIKLGRETLFEEECSEEEVQDELCPLTVQLAYVMAQQGRTGEAQELLDKVLHGAGGGDAAFGDETTRAVAANNAAAAALGAGAAPAAASKALKTAVKKLNAMVEDPGQPGSLRFSPALAARLSGAQQRLLSLNRGLAYLLSGRVDAAREVVTALTRSDPTAGSTPQPAWAAPHLLPLLQAALLAKEGKGAEADAVLETAAAAAASTGSSVAAGGAEEGVWPVLARAQLALESGDVARAAKVLDGLAAPAEVAGSAAVLATRVALHQQLGHAEAAEALLQRAIDGLGAGTASGRGAGAGQSPAAACLEALVALRLRQGRVADAVATFGQLRAAQGGAGAGMSASTAALLARLVRCLASSGAASSLSTATSLGRELPPVGTELRGLDAGALEGAAVGARGAGAGAGAKRGADEMEVEGGGKAGDAAKAGPRRPPKKKKSKKRQLPKGWNPDLPNGGLPPADPERWLPKWQRTETKRRKKTSAAREKGAVKGSQGAGKVDESLDRTKGDAPKADTKAAAAKVGPSLPARAGKKAGKR